MIRKILAFAVVGGLLAGAIMERGEEEAARLAGHHQLY